MAEEQPRQPDSWANVFMAVARSIARRSKDPSAQVGAVVVDPLNVIISTGFNGPPRRINDKAVDWARPAKYAFVKHAADNALWYAIAARGLHGLHDCRLYLTSKPCPACILSIVRAEVGEVVWDGTAESKMMDAEAWEMSQRLAAMGGVTLTQFRSGS